MTGLPALAARGIRGGSSDDLQGVLDLMNPNTGWQASQPLSTGNYHVQSEGAKLQTSSASKSPESASTHGSGSGGVVSDPTDNARDQRSAEENPHEGSQSAHQTKTQHDIWGPTHNIQPQSNSLEDLHSFFKNPMADRLRAAAAQKLSTAFDTLTGTVAGSGDDSEETQSLLEETKNKMLEFGIQKPVMCDVCGQAPLDVALTPCGHMFHAFCMLRYFSTMQTQQLEKDGTTTKTACPICFSDIEDFCPCNCAQEHSTTLPLTIQYLSQFITSNEKNDKGEVGNQQYREISGSGGVSNQRGCARSNNRAVKGRHRSPSNSEEALMPPPRSRSSSVGLELNSIGGSDTIMDEVASDNMLHSHERQESKAGNKQWHNQHKDTTNIQSAMHNFLDLNSANRDSGDQKRRRKTSPRAATASSFDYGSAPPPPVTAKPKVPKVTSGSPRSRASSRARAKEAAAAATKASAVTVTADELGASNEEVMQMSAALVGTAAGAADAADAAVVQQSERTPVAAAVMDTPTRRGKWSQEECKYAQRLVEDFKLGYLPLANGTSLRSLLSTALNCDPMRISKKFAGKDCIGKQLYKHNDDEVNKLLREGKVEPRQKELLELERVFLKFAARRPGRRRRRQQQEEDDLPAKPISAVTAEVMHPLSTHTLHLN